VARTQARSRRKIADADSLRITFFKPSDTTPNAWIHADIWLAFESYFVLKVYRRKIHDHRGHKENLTGYAASHLLARFRHTYGATPQSGRDLNPHAGRTEWMN
jgi:hypothetical protein